MELCLCIWHGQTRKYSSYVPETRQNLPHLTRSDMVTGLLGFTSIQAPIDTLKLLFLQSLCKLGPDERANKLFKLRLLQFKTTRTNHMIGFIPDVHRVLSKHALTPYIDEYCNTGVFPDKALWKRVVKSRVLYEEELAWIERLKGCRDFDRFHKVHTSLTTANVWRVRPRDQKAPLRWSSWQDYCARELPTTSPTYVICVLQLTLIKCTTCYFSVNVTIVLI